MTFSLYFAGAENATWRNILKAQSAPMAASFWPMDKKSKNQKASLDYFGTERVLVDGGGHSVRDLDEEGLSDYADRYQDYVDDNAGDLAVVVELDPPGMSQAEREFRRKDFYATLRPGLFHPVWKGEGGVRGLHELGEKYGAVSVTSTVHQDASLAPALNRLANSGVLVHAAGISDVAKIRLVRFTSASSLTWTTPSRYGSLHLWDGRRLILSAKDQRDKVLRVHKAAVVRAGVDIDMVRENKGYETVRLALWSWQQWASAFDGRSRTARPTETLRGNALFSDMEVELLSDAVEDDQDDDLSSTPATGSLEAVDDMSADVAPVTDLASRRREREEREAGPVTGADLALVPVQPEVRPLVEMPGLLQMLPTDESGERAGLTLLDDSARSGRACDTCYLAERCPQFKANSLCVFAFPVDTASPEGLAAVRTALLRMQTQRVAFGFMVEQVEGGAPDPHLSKELGALWKQIQVDEEIRNPKVRASFEFEAPANNGGSFLDRLLGNVPPPPAPPTVAVPIRVLEHQE